MTTGLSEDGWHAARERLRAAELICVLTGAGMSAESGIATFRGAHGSATGRSRAESPPSGGGDGQGPSPGGRQSGLWARFDPAQLASEDGFRANPARVWQWYAERRTGVRAAEPNAGHRALAAFAHRHPGRLTLVTQNVDDLHQRAGSTGAIRLHGDILADRWLSPCPRPTACDTAWAVAGEPPMCTDCGNAVRPGVVWFGESLPLAALQRAEAAADGCQVMLVVGTSGAVWPAAGLAARARRAGAFVVIVNPHASEIDDQAHARLAATAAQALPALLDPL